MMKKGILFFVFTLLTLQVFAKITFTGYDLNQNDEVLFTAKQDKIGASPYKSLFYVRLKDGMPEFQPELLTCYPEAMELLEEGNILQLRNRYGIAQYDSRTDKITWVEKTEGMAENSLPMVPYAVSPDGKWVCRIERTGICSGKLLLEKVSTKEIIVLSDNVLNSYEEVPVKWAPDSSVLLYEKNDDIYFCTPDALLRSLEIEEKYRKIGRGTINSVCWTSRKYLAYIDDYLIYKINVRELYTLGLYSGIIGQGKAVGRLPFQFDCKTDKFSVNEEVTGFLIIQYGKIFSYLRIPDFSQECSYCDVIYTRPYTDSTASLLNTTVFWDDFGYPILWQEKLPYNGKAVKDSIYRITSISQQVLEVINSGKPFISPDKRKIAFFAGGILYVYDLNSWTRVAELPGEKIVSALWIDNSTLYVGGEKTIRKWNIKDESVSTICLSSVSTGNWNDSDYSIVADVGGGNYYRYNETSRKWNKEIVSPEISVQTQNGRYRIFAGTTGNQNYENALYVRTLSSKSAITKPFYPGSVVKTEDPKKVALVFDAYDNSDGLSRIITILKKYNAKASFFFNGEFIRRYPSETTQIATNGFECGSMFFTQTNLVDNTFIIDEDFIRRGLARNEDEFYNATKKELALFWHAPYYAETPEIIQYGENSGYTYIDSFHAHSDYSPENIMAPQLIQEFYEEVVKNGGGIIPITVGFSRKTPEEPLYKYMDLLICALIDGGFEFVTISSL